MAQNQNQGQGSKLEPIFSHSFTANHLLQVSIVKQEADQSYKRAYFCFITLAPGTQNPQGGRSFDFNSRVTMKVDGHKIGALAHAMRAYIRGQEAMIGPFTIYVDSSKSQYGQGGGGKSLLIQRTQNQKTNNSPMLTFFFKAGQNQALGFSMTPADALSAADIFEFIAKKCLELEFARGPAAAQTGAYENPNPGTFSEPGHDMTQGPFGNTSATPFGNASAPPTGNNVVGNFADSFGQFSDSPF